MRAQEGKMKDSGVSRASTLLEGADIAAREARLEDRLAELEKREQAIQEREEALRAAEQEKKQVLLRIPMSLWNALARWADRDLRSINGQIEYLLTRAVREKEKKEEK